ncbi:MAG: hypothetical protein ACRERD_10875 [Candidatus Binatia bacterium]
MMKSGSTLKAMVVGTALTVSLWNGTAAAGGEFVALEGIPAEALSPGEMAAVEGKQVKLLGLTDSNGLNGLDGLLGPNSLLSALNISLDNLTILLNLLGPDGLRNLALETRRR